MQKEMRKVFGFLNYVFGKRRSWQTVKFAESETDNVLEMTKLTAKIGGLYGVDPPASSDRRLSPQPKDDEGEKKFSEILASLNSFE